MKEVKIYRSKYKGWVDENNQAIARECSRCGVKKDITEFSPHSGSRGFGGKRSHCKKCNNSYCAKYSDSRSNEYHLWKHAKYRAEKKGLEFSLILEDLKIPEHCPVLGIPLSKGEGTVHDGSPTIDRVDNTKGYTPDNTEIISYRANSLKGSASPKEIKMLFEYYCKD